MRSTLWRGFFLLLCPQCLGAQPISTSGGILHLVDAVQTSIARHPTLEIQRQEIEVTDALRRQASSIFDPILQAGVDRGRLYSPLASATGFSLSPSDTSQIGASYSKLLRNGLQMTGSVGLS